MIDTLILSFGRRELNFLVTKIVIGTSVILLVALINLNDEQNFTIVILRFWFLNPINIQWKKNLDNVHYINILSILSKLKDGFIFVFILIICFIVD